MPAKGYVKYKTINDLVDDKIGRNRISTDCWIWPGALDTSGYACGKWEGKTRNIHVIMYESIFGPVPEGLELDHLCNHRSCINPTHLEAIPHAENVLRGELGRNRRDGVCPVCHPLTEDNIYVTTTGYIKCRACWIAQGRRG